jgi:hypothetical protein
MIAIVVGVVCAVICVIGAIIDPRRTAAAYLTAYVSCVAVVLGALAMIMIARVTAATWFVALRRQAEQVVATLPVLCVLFIPILIAMRVLYPWAAPSAPMTPVLHAAIRAKAAYLNAPFFIVRAVIYWATWIGLGEALRRASLAQDRGDTSAIERRMRVMCAVGLGAFALTMTFASFDWMMSLAPAWYSTIYGVDYFAGGMVGALALLAVLVVRGRRRGELPETIGADHMHALAKLLLTFVLFWVYIGFSQLIVIWSAEIPVEASWYALRMHGGWRLLGGVLVAGHFVVPFCLLLVRSVKRSMVAMSALGVWLLVMHYLDIYWIVMPDALPPNRAVWGFVLDAAALGLIASIASVAWAMRRRGEPIVPAGDPKIDESLAYNTELV